MAKKQMPEIGDTAKDTISGFIGVVTSETFYLNGCIRLGISPPVGKDGKLNSSEFFDIEQVALVKKGTHKPLQPSGGPMPAPMPRSNPR
jgi:hypothetical protein